MVLAKMQMQWELEAVTFATNQQGNGGGGKKVSHRHTNDPKGGAKLFMAKFLNTFCQGAGEGVCLIFN